MQTYQDMLLDPPFAKDPPVKLNIPAKTLGLIYAILAAIGALFGLFGILGALGLSALATAAGAFAGLFWLAMIGTIVSWAGTIVVAWGGYRMFQGDHAGRRLVVYGLAVEVIGSLLSSLFGIGDLVGWVFGAVISFVLYYLVIISRFPDEPALVATPAL